MEEEEEGELNIKAIEGTFPRKTPSGKDFPIGQLVSVEPDRHSMIRIRLFGTSGESSHIRGLLEKYPTLFFCENLVGFNEARLHEVTLNLHTHA